MPATAMARHGTSSTPLPVDTLAMITMITNPIMNTCHSWTQGPVLVDPPVNSTHKSSNHVAHAFVVGSVAGPGARFALPGSRRSAWPDYERAFSPSLQRFTRYPESKDSIRPLALPMCVRVRRFYAVTTRVSCFTRAIAPPQCPDSLTHS